MIFTALRSCLVLAMLQSSVAMDHFRAAVYEHAVIYPEDRTTVLNRSEALKVVMKNMQVYRNQSMQAASMEAKIIVFPEYGLYGLGWTRQTLEPYLEIIADPQNVTWNPCDAPNQYHNTEIQRNLSCIAKQASIYLVANMGARVPCNRSDPNCPADLRYQFSASVVYNTNGDLVGRYFKYNIDENEGYLDKPAKPDHSVFNTSFGRFGIITSQDILYYEPAISIIKQNITNLVYPTAWKNELPLFSAIEFHSAFSEGMHVNLLSANLHIPSKGYFGSGLYWPTGVSINGSYVNNQVPWDEGSLVVDTMTPFTIPPNVYSKSRSSLIQHKRSSDVSADPQESENNKRKVRPNRKFVNGHSLDKKEKENVNININGDVYNAMILREAYGSVNACQGSLCCSALYESGISQGDLYALAAFDGMHTSGRRYYLQACAFIRCANSSVESCGQPTTSSSGYMSKMSFQGNFSTPYVFPEVLTDQNGTPGLVRSIWYYMGSVIIDVGLYGGTLSISMLGRDYSKD